MLTEIEFDVERELFLSDLKIISADLKLLADGLPEGLGYPQYVEVVGKLRNLNIKLHKWT